MKTYVYSADEFGCGLHRMIWPAEALRRAGHDVVVVRPKERAAMFQGKLSASGELLDVAVPGDADVIVLQRITHKYLVDAIKLLRRRGIAVIVDMDDDLATINPNNPAFDAMHPRFGYSADHNWKFTQHACEAATLVTVSTDALVARYAPHGRGVVLRNCIPERYLQIPRIDSNKIGWGGSLHSHPDDMDALGSSIVRLVAEGVPLHIVGPDANVRRALRLYEEHEFTFTGPCDPLEEWPRELGKLGVGIAPLADTKFNAAKSWLKPLEYSALGVPCVMTPSAEYARLHARGVGILARKPQQWLRILRSLTDSADMRVELSEKGRAAAAELTIEGNAWRWLEAWEKAYKTEQTSQILSR